MRKREKRVRVWSSIDPDDDLKLDIMSRNSKIPKHILIRRAINTYVRDIDSIPNFDFSSPQDTNLGDRP